MILPEKSVRKCHHKIIRGMPKTVPKIEKMSKVDSPENHPKNQKVDSRITIRKIENKRKGEKAKMQWRRELTAQQADCEPIKPARKNQK